MSDLPEEIIDKKLAGLARDCAKYLKKDELDSVPWLPADISIIEKLKSWLKD